MLRRASSLPGRNDARHLTTGEWSTAPALEEWATQSGQTVRPGQIQLRPSGVNLASEVDVADLEIVLRLLVIGAIGQRSGDGRLDVDRVGIGRRTIDRV